MSTRAIYWRLSTMARTVLRTAEVLRAHRLGTFIPLLGLLMVLSAVMWVVSAIAPVAPFVYSLF
jgi:hypothetical protein